MNNNEYIDSLVAKYLAGEASDSETEELMKWKEASAENSQYFIKAQHLFSGAASISKEHSFHTDAAWEKVRRQLQVKKESAIVREIDSESASAWYWLRVAAMLVLVAGAGYGVYRAFYRETVKEFVYASTNDTESHVLSDSTGVVLNKNSKIVCTFSNKIRKVDLSGEAFFQLSDDPGRPFEVHAGALTIRDIGTSFNVDAAEGSDTVLVYVETGEVILKGKSDRSLTVTAGGRAAYIRSRDSLLQVVVSDTNALAWKTKVFVFENAGLESVAQKLSEVYDLAIEVLPSAKKCRITATFMNETSDNVIDVIAETLQLKVKRDKNKVILEGGNCEGDE